MSQRKTRKILECVRCMSKRKHNVILKLSAMNVKVNEFIKSIENMTRVKHSLLTITYNLKNSDIETVYDTGIIATCI